MEEGSFPSSLRDNLLTKDHLFRICPGRFFAENTLFIIIAPLLQAFEILPASDSSGKRLSIDYALTPGFVSYVNWLIFIITILINSQHLDIPLMSNTCFDLVLKLPSGLFNRYNGK